MSYKANIGNLRSAEGITQKELAKLLSVSQNTMSSWENDESKAKHLYRFTLLCKTLECEHTVFLESDEPLKQSISSVGLPIETIRQQIRTSVCYKSPIADLRNKQAGLSQERLAEAVEVSVNTIQNWESGNNATRRHNTIARLCEILDCTYRNLVTEPDDELPETCPESHYPGKTEKQQRDGVNERPSIEPVQERDDEKLKGGSKRTHE